MIFSKSCEYALKAVLLISSKGTNEEISGLTEIAEAIGSPKYFTGKILQLLTRNKIISSIKGPNGGFYISKKQQQLKLYDVVAAVEGDQYFDRCILGLENCDNAHPCPLHKYFSEHKKAIKNIFMTRSIKEYVSDVQHGKAFLY